MEFLEKDLEDLIWGAIQNDMREELIKRGLHISTQAKFIRQYNFGSYGICDLISFSIERYRDKQYYIYIDIFELKKDFISYQTLDQSLGYARACQLICKELTNASKNKKRFIPEITLNLIGKELEMKNNFSFVPSIFNCIKLYKYNFDFFKGLNFSLMEDFYITNATIKTPTLSISELRDLLC